MTCINCSTILNHNKYKYKKSSKSYVSNDNFMNKEIIVYKHKDIYYLKLCCVNTVMSGLHTIMYKNGNNADTPQETYWESSYNLKTQFKYYKLFMVDSKIVKLYNINFCLHILTGEYTDMRASVHYPLNIKYCNILTSHEKQLNKKDIIISKLNTKLQKFKNKSEKFNKHKEDKHLKQLIKKDNRIDTLTNEIKKLNDMIEDQEYIINKLTQQIL